MNFRNEKERVNAEKDEGDNTIGWKDNHYHDLEYLKQLKLKLIATLQ